MGKAKQEAALGVTRRVAALRQHGRVGSTCPDPFLLSRRWLPLGPGLGLELGGCETYLGSCLTSLLSGGDFFIPSLSRALSELSLETEWSMGKVPPEVHWCLIEYLGSFLPFKGSGWVYSSS